MNSFPKKVAAVTLPLVLGMVSVIPAQARVPVNEVNFHNMEKDTTRITEILIEAEKIADSNKRIVAIAEKFIDVPYVAHTLESEDGTERLTVNLDELDCTTFVETVAALSKTAGEHRTSWRDFLITLEELRYRGGEMNGYPSRLHYISDWVVDNIHRGNVVEVTADIPGNKSQTKSIDFMTKHRDSYKALADSANFERMKNVEMGYRNHLFPFIPMNALNNKATREAVVEGDLIGFTTKVQGLDITHMGIVVKDDKGIPYIIHASQKDGKVERDKFPLFERMRRSSLPGFRLIRIRD